jgi:hypothetical protein
MAFFNRRLFTGVLLVFLATSCGKESTEMAALPDAPSFTHHIKPLLSDRCFACHGPDETKQKAGLALHTAERAYAELKDKPGLFAIVPGNTDKSALYQRIISSNEDVVMPPPDSHLSLKETEKELIRRWIENGAVYEGHWAFTAPEPVAVPDAKEEDWAKNDIDHFVQAKHREKAMAHNPEADRPTLLRRVTFDLTGLPPSPEEIEAFVSDQSPDAFEKVVDRLLASPRYGERMTTDWLDLSRYADSHGYQDDRPRSMWPWRDWLIRAFNDNLSFKDFVVWQLAGDLLPEPTYEQKLATGFNRNHPITQEGGVIPEEYLAEYASDRTHVFSTAFLGLTVECAKCHTHKYDPILHEDYYQLTSFFNNIEEVGKIGMYDLAAAPRMKSVDPGLEQEIEEVESYIAGLEQQIKDIEKTGDIPAQVDENLDQTLEKGLVAYYGFDRNEGERTFSALPDGPEGWLNFNLPPTFQLPKVTKGKYGDALKFDGKNYVSLGMTGDFEQHQTFSASLWIKHDGRRKGTAAIFGKRMDELRHNGYDLVLTKDNKLAFRLAGFWWQPHHHPEGTESMEVRTARSIPANRWQHVVVVYDGSGKADGVQLFVNDGAGNNQARPQVQRTVLDSLKQHTLLNGNHFALGNYNQRGRNWGDFGGFANGAIDEFRLYNRMLSRAEIARLTSLAPAAAPLKESIVRNQGSGFSIQQSGIREQDWQEHYLLHEHTEYQRVLALLDSARSIDRTIPEVMIMRERDTILPTHVRLRGEYDKPGVEVTRAAPSALPPLPPDAPKDRLGLAQWLFLPNHPLTARVAVNRLWQQCFGRGIVGSAADFGNQGELPTHPELLDYLALKYRDGGWDTKAMLRLIVTSATYRQSARAPVEALKTDPDNRWLARGPASKLTAEMLRDQALMASGLMNNKIGGKWVKPYQPPGLWNEMASDIGEPVYRESKGQSLFRRSLYTYFKRTIPPPDMITMDAAGRTVCTVKRQATSTPLQSLVVLNSPLYTEAARQLATTLLSEGVQENALLETAFERVLSRKPVAAERLLLQGMLNEHKDNFAGNPEAALAYLSVGSTGRHNEADATELAAASLVVSAIFNLDEAQRK